VTTLSNEQVRQLLEPVPTLESLLQKKRTKLVAVNALRRQVGLPEIKSENDMTVQDKRGWLVLLDLWREGITEERAKESLEKIYKMEDA